jgi:hexosaminidase
MTPNDFVYTDLLQGDALAEPDQTSYKKVRLKKTYEYEPLPDGIDPKYILGGQACLWSEKVPTIRQAEYMTFPRAWAISDILWSPENSKNWDKFIQRMDDQFERCDVAGINYARSAYDAIVTGAMKDGKLYANITTEISGLDIYYTLNETLPDKFTAKYTGPVEIPEGTAVTLKVITYRDGKPVGKMIPVPREELVKRSGK